MRPIETWLLLANLLTFSVLVVPRLQAVRWMGYLAPIALLIAVAQVLVEGPRWQMVPAYALTGLFFLVWLLQSIARIGRPANRLVVGLGVLGLAVSIVLPIVLPVFRFPQPSGPYEIGTLTYHWVDVDRPEIFTADPNDRRELMVQVWYPAKGDPSLPRAPYVQDARVLAPVARLLHLPGFFFGHLQYVTTNAILSAPVADGVAREGQSPSGPPGEPNYPVLIFSHGRGGFLTHNTLQVEELVSHGYIVAAIDHPYVAAGVVFPDGRLAAFDSRMYDSAPPEFIDGVMSYLAQDTILTLDQLAALNRADPNGILTGRLDLQRAGVLGASFDGAVIAEACRLEPRLQAGLVMDVFIPAGVARSGLQQPIMVISRDAQTMQLEGSAQADIDKTQSAMRAVFENSPGAGYFIRVPGMFHADYSDARLLSPLASQIGLSGPIDGQRAHSIINAYSLAFFDRHLKGRPAALLDGPAEQYPEVLFETRRP